MIRSFIGFRRMSQQHWEEFRKLAFSLYLPEGETIEQLTERLEGYCRERLVESPANLFSQRKLNSFSHLSENSPKN